MSKSRQIKYSGKDFSSFKSELQNLAKQYFPEQFSNFNDYSIEMMLMEMMSYTGDVLSFNMDENFKQLFQKYAYEPESIFRNAKERGYDPQTVSVALGEVMISQIVPATIIDGNSEPDTEFAGIVNRGSIFSDYTGESKYNTIELCDMRYYDDFELEEKESEENPAYYRIFKNVKVQSGLYKTKEITVNDPKSNLKLYVDSNVAFIDSIEDSEGNEWHQVDHMAEDTVFESIENVNLGDEFDEHVESNPYVLKLRRASRRFVVDHNSRGECHVIFGQGDDIVSDDLKNLNTRDSLTTNETTLSNISNASIIENFLHGDSYGLSPHNITLYINYITSDGENDNANANTVININRLNVIFPEKQNQLVEDSFDVVNLEPISGARFLNDPDHIKYISTKAFSSQRRCVTKRDYIIRSLLMPTEYGSISKVFAERDYTLIQNEEDKEGILRREKSRTLNLYVLSTSQQGNLQQATNITKRNLANFLEKYRVISDSINILDPYIINIGVDFSFTAKKGYNVDAVILNISRKIEEYFDTDNFEINQPVVMEQLKYKMYEADGVLTIDNIDFVNKWDENNGYSGVEYQVKTSGNNYDNSKGILYPPADVGIFEIKYPNRDIRGQHS